MVDDQPGKLLSYEAILRDLGENLLVARSADDKAMCISGLPTWKSSRHFPKNAEFTHFCASSWGRGKPDQILDKLSNSLAHPNATMICFDVAES